MLRLIHLVNWTDTGNLPTGRKFLFETQVLIMFVRGDAKCSTTKLIKLVRICLSQWPRRAIRTQAFDLLQNLDVCNIPKVKCHNLARAHRSVSVNPPLLAGREAVTRLAVDAKCLFIRVSGWFSRLSCVSWIKVHLSIRFFSLQ